MPLTIGVPRETARGERRVALVPDAVKRLRRQPVDLVVERGAGASAFVSDEAYEAAGARLGTISCSGSGALAPAHSARTA